MRIAFFGPQSTFDYYQIGGVESFIRRLAFGLVQKGVEVDYVMFDSLSDKNITLDDGNINLKYYSNFQVALRDVLESYSHIITVYLPPLKRIAYILFRFIHSKRLNFHLLLFGLSNSIVKRVLTLIYSKLFYTYVFSISPRIHTKAKNWGLNSVLLLPPVPNSFFLKTNEKASLDTMRISFIGRVDRGKGIDLAIENFLYLNGKENFQTRIFGLHNTYSLKNNDIHEWLQNQSSIIYEFVHYQSYSPDVEHRLHSVLVETDVLLLPYRLLNSTIDTPLLLLEGMAHVCAIITRPIGNLAEIYGTHRWMVDNFSDHDDIFNLLNKLRGSLNDERERLYQQNQKLFFSTHDISDLFHDSISKIPN